MKSSDLNKLLTGISSGVDLGEIIQKEADFYQKAMEKKGSSVPLVFNEDEDINLNDSVTQRPSAYRI